MPTSNPKPAFAIWFTGLPASGKSTLAGIVRTELLRRGVLIVILESDILRRILTPNATYSDPERDAFYQQLADIGAMLVHQGIPVIFDATANRRGYRDHARRQIPDFVEVYVNCPLQICAERDPKKIYRKVNDGTVIYVPGAQVEYEAPLRPDLVVRGDREDPHTAAERIVAALEDRCFIRRKNHS